MSRLSFASQLYTIYSLINLRLNHKTIANIFKQAKGVLAPPGYGKSTEIAK